MLSHPLKEAMNARAPKLKGDTLEARAMSAAERQGYERAILELEILAEQVATQSLPSTFVAGLDQFEQRAQPLEQ